MYNLLILLAVIPILLGNPVPIVGGSKAKSISYQVSIGRYGHSCGGSIVSNRTVITAAHCILGNATDYSVRAGTNTRNKGGQRVTVIDYAIHPNYNSTSYDYDIAVLYLNTSLQFNRKVNAIPMAKANDFLAPATLAIISGWGYKRENARSATLKLMTVHIPTVSKETCRNKTYSWTDRKFCAGYQNGTIDACIGDSGGPLVAHGKLFGVISAGKGCARPNSVGLYISIPFVRLWIDQTILALEQMNLNLENSNFNIGERFSAGWFLHLLDLFNQKVI